MQKMAQYKCQVVFNNHTVLYYFLVYNYVHDDMCQNPGTDWNIYVYFHDNGFDYLIEIGMILKYLRSVSKILQFVIDTLNFHGDLRSHYEMDHPSYDQHWRLPILIHLL